MIAETQPKIGYIQHEGEKYPFLYLWEISGNSTGHTAKLKITSNSKDYYIFAGDKIIIESPHIKIPYNYALGGSFRVLFYKNEDGKDKKIGEFRFSVANKFDVAKTILWKSIYALGLVDIIFLIAGVRLDELQNAIIVSIIVPIIYFVIVYLLI